MILLLVACGGARAKKQASGQLDLPGFPPQNKVFSLTDGEKAQYWGNFLIWGETASPEQILAIAQASDETSFNQAMELEVFHQSLKPLLERQKTQTEVLEALQKEAVAERAARILDYNVRHQDTLKLKAETWFEDQLSSLQGVGLLDEEGREDALNKFGFYCEAKVWHLATARSVLFGEYSQRPSPFAMCEAYYKEAGILSEDEPECAPAANSNSEFKNYFQCIWKHGVKNTIFWQKKYIPNPKNEDFLDKFAKSIDDGNFATRYSSYKTRELDFVLRGRITIGNRQFLQSDGTAEVDGLGCLGEKGSVVKGLLDLWELEDASASDSCATYGQLFATEDQNNPQLQKIKETIRLLGYRDTATGGLSVNDLIYNNPFSKDDMLKDDLKDSPVATRVQPIMVSIDPSLNELRPDYQEKINKIQADLASLSQEKKEAEQRILDLRTEYNQKIAMKSVKGVNSPGALLTLLGQSVSIQRMGGQIIFEWGLLGAGNKKIRACALEDTGESIACEATSEAFAQGTLHYDRDSGLLRLAWDLHDPESFGFNHLPRPDDEVVVQFNDINPESLRGQRVELELYPNLVGEHLGLLSGLIRIKDDTGTDLFSGIAKLTDYEVHRAIMASY
jgi:hypothetical protein